MSYITCSLGFIIVMMLQYGIFSRSPMLSGTADLILLFVIAWSLHQKSRYYWIVLVVFGSVISTFSAMPFFLPLITYCVVYLAANALKNRVWQSPLLVMFMLTFFGTLLQHSLSFMVLFLKGVSFNISDAFADITLPSLLLNMLLAIPVHALIQETTRNLYPTGLEL